jgi:hypothetical protein
MRNLSMIILLTIATSSFAIDDNCKHKLQICDNYVQALQSENKILYNKIGALDNTIKQKQSESKLNSVKYWILGALVGLGLGIAIAK